MSEFAEFHFLRAWWLIALPFGIAAILFCWRNLAAHSNWRRVCDAHLLAYLLRGDDRPLGKLGLYLLLLGWTLAVLAVAGPAWERLPQPVYHANDARVFILDLSHSMDSPDLPPSRLTRAKFKLSDLVDIGRGRQQGLVVFANDAFMVSPLSDDGETLHNLIPALETNTLPAQGSRADLALTLAAELFENAELAGGEIILLSDGLGQVAKQSAAIAAELAAKNYRVSVLAVGTAEGAPVSQKNGEFLKDAAGNIVLPRVDFAALQHLALQGGGRFARLRADYSDIESLTADVALGARQSQTPGDEIKADQWRDRGPYLLLLLLPIAAAAFRRGWLLTLFLSSQLLVSPPSHAFGWKDLWLTQAQQAARAHAENDFAALTENKIAQWRGVGWYREQNYAGAVQAFANPVSAIDYYNYATALAQTGQWDAAIKTYKDALALQPDFIEARENKALLEQIIEQAKQQAEQGETMQAQEMEEGELGEDAETMQAARAGEPGEEGEESGEDEGVAAGEEGEEGEDGEDGEDGEAGDEESMALLDEDGEQDEDQDAEDSLMLQTPMDEQTQALQQWLRKIPDDPGGLLRRKFVHQQRERAKQNPGNAAAAQKW